MKSTPWLERAERLVYEGLNAGNSLFLHIKNGWGARDRT